MRPMSLTQSGSVFELQGVQLQPWLQVPAEAYDTMQRDANEDKLEARSCMQLMRKAVDLSHRDSGRTGACSAKSG